MAKKTNVSVADATLSFDRGEMMTSVLNDGTHTLTPEERADNLKSMSVDKLLCALALFSKTANGFLEIAAAIENEIEKRDESEFIAAFGKQDVAVAVEDQATHESYGGASVTTKSKTTRSTITSKKNRDLVLEAIKKAGLEAKFTKTSIELQNDALFTAFADGSLPNSVSSLLSESTSTSRDASFVPGFTEDKGGK